MKITHSFITVTMLYGSISSFAYSQDTNDTPSPAMSVQLPCENTSLVQCATQCLGSTTNLCLNGISTEEDNSGKLAIIHTSKLLAENATACLTACIEKEKGEEADETQQQDSGAINDAENIWANRFLIGATRQSSYNEEGENEGLSESSALAQFTFNARWFNKKEGNGDTVYGNFLTQLEFGVTLYELAATSDTTPPDQEMPPTDTDPMPDPMPEMDSDDDTPSFNDVAGTLDAYAKLSISPGDFFHSDDYRSIGSLGLLAGFRTRDTLTDDNNDGVAFYTGPTFELNYYNQDIRNKGNTAPRGGISISYLHFEEYGGAENEWRWVINGNWKIVKDKPFVAGIRANLGEGADDVGVFLGIEANNDQLLSFFGF